MTQHAALSPERWSRFAIDRQILMIANEMNRTSKRLAGDSNESIRLGYERVLRLADLTSEGVMRPALRRELRRWRDVAAGLYANETADPVAHRAACRALLLLNPVAARQIEFLAI